MKFSHLVLIFALPVTLMAADPPARSYSVHVRTAVHHGKGLKRTSRFHDFLKKSRRMSALRLTTAIPGAADLTPFVSPPEDQGSCGSCWDFSLTKALRSAWMVAGHDPGRLDFNYLLNNCGPGTKEYGCNGGDFDAADNFTQPYGPGLDSQDPYTASEGRCKKLPVAASSVSHTMLGGANGPSFQDLAYAISASRQMVSIDVAVVGDWENYSGGVYNGCSGTADDINHMIDAVGYDCETSKDAAGNCLFNASGYPVNGDGWLKVQNNWGTSWGEAGYMRTRMLVHGSKCNAVATDALVFQISAPVPPTPPAPPVPPVPPVPPTPAASCTRFLCSWWCGFFWCN